VQSAFTKRGVDYLTDPIKEITNEVIDRFIDKGEFEFINDFSSPITVGVLGILLGMDRADQKDIRYNIVSFLSTDRLPENKRV